jgi:hypothetical protein
MAKTSDDLISAGPDENPFAKPTLYKPVFNLPQPSTVATLIR